MSNSVLFNSQAGNLTANAMIENMRAVGAADCDVLYVHTDMTFGLPAKGLKRSELLGALLAAIESLAVSTLIFPTFTFSFCNNEVYDVQNTRTHMGALNDYVRKSGKGLRTQDPLLSVIVLGEPLNFFDTPGKYSLGKDSHYDKLHNCGKKVNFLFFGADMRDCFTYTHYMEAVIGVAYRYDRAFTGTIIDNGVVLPSQEYFLYSTYANCTLTSEPVVYNAMKAKKQLSFAPAGEGRFCCFSEADAFKTISECIRQNPLCLTDGSFDPTKNDMAYTHPGRINSVK